MNTNADKELFWELAQRKENPQKVAQAWNALFGEDYDYRRRVTTFLREARSFNNVNFQARHVRKYLRSEENEEEEDQELEEEPEDDTITSPEIITQAGTSTTDPVTPTAMIITSLADAVADMDIGHLPPRAAARAVKKQYWDILRPIVHSAGERAMSNAETLWRQRLQGPKTSLV